MPEWVHALWIGPIVFLPILWAAFIVLGIKGLIFHRQPRSKTPMPPEIVDPETGEVIQRDHLGLGCSLCLCFIIWPLLLASKIDDWLPPPKNSN